MLMLKVMASLHNASLGSTTQLAKDIISPATASDALRFTLATLCIISLSILCGSVSRNVTKWKDTLTIAALLAAWNWRIISTLVDSILPGQIYVYTLAVVCLQASIASRVRSAERATVHRDSPSTSDHPLPPLIFPCRTTHARMFPTRHSFSYSYLFVGIPIGWDQSAGSLLSTHPSRTRTWYSVHSSDYLARKPEADGLKFKLDAYLATQGVSPNDYPYAYLVTAPRFLGFSFNPVSFWYLYDVHKTLAAMILEVNNTFDERRMYFMKKKNINNDELNQDNANNNQDFTSEWAKDFHVSPFNDRDGSYSLTVKNPLAFLGGEIRVDNNIVLRSAEGKAKLVARIFSTESAVDPTNLSLLQSWLFIARWWWVGFMTNPRILREARLLWIKKLQVFYRPEVLSSSIGRNETAEEVSLAVLFQDYLQRLVSMNNVKVDLEYIPAAGRDRDRPVFWESSSADMGTSSQALRIKILTPAFYEEIVKAHSIHDAFDKCCFNPDAGAKMVEVSETCVLRDLLQQDTAKLLHGDMAITHLERRQVTFRRGDFTSIFTKFLFRRGKHNTQSTHMGDFDGFVAKFHPSYYPEYCNIVARLLLADRIAFGFMPLLNTYALMLWSILDLFIASTASSLLRQQWNVANGLFLTLTLLVLHYLRGLWNGPGQILEIERM